MRRRVPVSDHLNSLISDFEHTARLLQQIYESRILPQKIR